ncbi:aldo/keto reductase [Lentzea aerocolonigenes]|uniref:aldo/keto reductase n=1 Tax=Lentzea aerocolonigenes TaxID=68170 RepID=UPI0004C400E1|nr:aldo/keto reductase [Lentzea aerocolonigenes]MCP2244382.1 Aldo/keto reductase [Lentzea aerocolonigenes]
MTVALPSGSAVPALGMGTWMMAEDPSHRSSEIAALREGLDLGLTLIDTAEMYANGGAESLVGEAIAGRRSEVFLVSKVLPSNASAAGTVRACEASLRRLGTDHLDLYLLHWRGSVPLAQTVEAFEGLREAGKIRHWGVSNLDLDDMRELTVLPGHCQTNQILYNLSRRGPEHDLLPWHASAGIPVMAYSPVEQGRLLGSPVLASVAARHDATPAQVALAWVLRLPHVNAIPKAGTVEHVRENAAALSLRLTDEDFAELDGAFPPPDGPEPLEML